MRSFRLIGLGMSQRFTVQINALNDRQGMAKLKAEQQPIFQGALQFLAALLQRRRLSPEALTLGDAPEEAAILGQFVLRVAERLLKILR